MPPSDKSIQWTGLSLSKPNTDASFQNWAPRNRHLLQPRPDKIPSPRRPQSFDDTPPHFGSQLPKSSLPRRTGMRVVQHQAPKHVSTIRHATEELPRHRSDTVLVVNVIGRASPCSRRRPRSISAAHVVRAGHCGILTRHDSNYHLWLSHCFKRNFYQSWIY